MSRDAVIRAEGLGKRYRMVNRTAATTVSDAARSALATIRERHRARDSGADSGWFWALRGVSFDVSQGEVLGIVGPNGAGKSTLLKILSRITEPTEGRASIWGHVGSLLEVGTGFHPELTGRENIFLNGAVLGMRRAEIEARLDEIVEFAGISRFLDMPVKRYSSGMYVRLAFAVAAHLDPEILLVDEVLSVGDQAFQRRCLGRMDEIAHSGRTILFVSHNLAAVSALCTNACLLQQGRMVEHGTVERVLERYMASVHANILTSLRERSDRQGSGELRFTDVGIGGPFGASPVPGKDATIQIAYEAEQDIRNVMVGFSVYGMLGEPLFVCSTRLTGEDIRAAPRDGVFRCTVPRLPLAPGRYTLNLYSEVNGVLADWVRDASSFEVIEGDFFGTGQLPPHSYFLLDHSWSVEEPSVAEPSEVATHP